MKNLHNTIVENLMRFSPKNLDVNQLKKFLTEQDIDYIERWKTEKAALDAFRQWETAVQNEGRTKLVKTNAYKDVTNDPTIVPVFFWNNFVTIDSMKNADTVKQQIDAALEKLTQQGVNLQDPSINISIISRASQAPASTGPNKDDNTGKKRIDHDYNGLLKFDAAGNVTPESKAAFVAKQKSDPQFGNKILAQKRGDAAANYIKSKGIKANITITPEIHPTDRSFIINAQVAGKEKYIAPISLPDMEIKIKLVAEWVVAPVWSMRDQEVAVFPKFYYSVNWKSTNGLGGSVVTMDDNNSGDNLNNSRWMQKKELEIVAKTGTGPDVARNRNPLQANKSSNFAGAAGEAQIDRRDNFLLGTGHFASKWIWEHVTNGASKTISELTGFNLGSWLSSTAATLGVTKDVAVETGQNMIHKFYGKLLLTPEQKLNAEKDPKALASYEKYGMGIADLKKDLEAYGDLNKIKSAAPGTKVSIEKTINLQDLATAMVAAGVPGVSAELSTDPKFWSEAAWFDSTVTPPKYGISLKENPNFFAGATFNKTPINK